MKVRFLCGMLLCCFGIAASALAETERELKPSEVAGLRTWEVTFNTSGSKDRRYVTWHYNVSFKNESLFELSEVDVCLRVTRGKEVVYESNIVPIRSFRNVGFSTKGTLLPMNKSIPIGPVDLTIPASKWTVDVSVDIVIAGAKTFRGKRDLHDVNHLYTRMLVDNTPDALTLVKKEPSLIRVRDADGFDTSAIAWSTCEPVVIQYVAEHGGSWTPVTKQKATIMHFAAINGAPGVLDFALKHGGKINSKTATGSTPLLKAIRFGYPKNVAWLLKHGANPNELYNGGTNPAYWAIHDGQTEALKELVAAGANRHFHNRYGQGWMHFCWDNQLIAPVVNSFGIPIDDCDPKFGVTTLMLSAQSGMTDTEIWFLQHGADPNRRDAKGRNAYDYSKYSNTFHTDRFFRDLVRRYWKRR